MPNTDLLYAALNRVIAAAPENRQPDDPSPVWDQNTWGGLVNGDPACGTACCLAGHTLLEAGYQMRLMDDGVLTNVRYVHPALDENDEWDRPGIGEGYVSERAREALGLDTHQAAVLFHADNTLEDLKRIVDQIVAGEEI